MGGQPKETVWILGAGFSRALGGPLIDELLLDRGRESLVALGGVKKTLSLRSPRVCTLVFLGCQTESACHWRGIDE
jgi:hypothetical protein